MKPHDGPCEGVTHPCTAGEALLRTSVWAVLLTLCLTPWVSLATLAA